MSVDSLAAIRAVQRDAVKKEVLAFRKTGERALYLHFILGHSRAAIVGAKIITTQSFKRARDAYVAGRMVGTVGRPALLHDSTEQNLVNEIQKAQESGKALTRTSLNAWVCKYIPVI
jgi:hypothetical protein